MRIKLPKPNYKMRVNLTWLKRRWRHDAKVSRIKAIWQRYYRQTRSAALAAAVLIVFSIGLEIFNVWNFNSSYQLSESAQRVLPRASMMHASYLKVDEAAGRIDYNTGYLPSMSDDSQSARPRFQASFELDPKNGTTVIDPVNSISVTFKPKFNLLTPKIVDSRLVYPLRGRDGAKVVTVGTSGFKEDIILNKAQSDELVFKYEMVLPAGLEARLENDGSIGFYGPDPTLLGNISTTTDDDAELLRQARQNADKTQLLFTIPTPVIFEGKRDVSSATASFELNDNELVIKASGLESASYPLSIDPSIYVETAAKLMRGNNETNIDFDVDNELIQKSQTTGARIDAWQGNLDMSEGIWDHGAAVAGGYIYRTGGRTGASKPQLLSQQTTDDSGSNNTFQMDMPAERPAGDLYVALMCHDNSGVTVSGDTGWIELANSGEFAAFYKIGTDEGGGNESSSYTFSLSGNEAKSGTIVRISGFNPTDPISGLPGVDSSGSNSTPEFPATTPDNSASLVIRAIGADNDLISDTGWVPSGHTKIASSNSGGQDCSFAAASLDSPPSAGTPVPAVDLADNSISDTWGGVSVAINPASSPPPPVITDQQSSEQASNSGSFTMSMPATRPAGDLYIALMCHDGTGSVSPPGGGGWTEYNDTREHAAYYKIGTNQGGGNEAANYTWSIGGSEIWAGVIIRVTGFDSSDPISGTPGSDSSSSNSTPVFPATTPDNNSTLIIRAAGADNDVPHPTNWIPSGHTKIDSGGPGTGGDCGYAAAFMNDSPAAGITTGSAAFGSGSGVSDSWGASTIAINPDPNVGGFDDDVRPTVNWAKFNSSTLAIESPNPGEGVCTDWCGNSVYDLPEPRRGHSMVAYNGYLYVIGGVDDNGNRESTVLIAKLGANGEPSLWHPTDTNKDNWGYWYSDSGLGGGIARSYFSASVYNNRIYVSGGQTNASSGGTTTMQYAEIRPNGTLGSWISGETLPGSSGRHGHTTHIYNDMIYLIGGNINGTLQNTVYYNRLNVDGSMNEWVQTNSFDTARSTMGGSFTAVWGAYIYLAGGCTAVNGNGHCTSIASDTQLASINADGSLGEWGLMGGLENSRIGYSLLAWQGGLYRLGGCTAQDSSAGFCIATLADVDYGVVNPAGEVSTVNISTPSGSGDCTGGNPINCDLPSPGDGASGAGNMLSMTTVLNGYLYVIGGCTDYDCNGSNPGSSDITGNTAYVSIDSNGNLSAPASCAGSSYGAWCVESDNRINGTTGIAAGGITTFNGRIYVVGGIDNTGDGSNEIYYSQPDVATGRPGPWQSSSFSSVGITGEMAYTYAYARANPANASTVPGNLFTFGGCGNIGTGPGCSSSNYRSHVYKCDIEVDGSIDDCSTSGQLQIDAELEDESDEGLGIHSGTVYANYIYLIGGFSAAVGDRDTIYYAKFDDNNNVVSVVTNSAGGNNDDWVLSENRLSVGRRRGWAFGYNGHIYAVGGYDDTGTGIIPFIEWAKMDVSDGSIEEFVTSSVTINQRWGLSMAVSNSYAYVIGGCNVGISPGGCSSFERAVQTFQLYNNDSGAPVGYNTGANLFNTDRLGASSAIHNGYIYVAGGCISTADCTNATNSVQYAQLDEYGNIGSWSAAANLPEDRAWGQLEVAGGTLYYIGGQSDSSTDERAEVYYGTPGGGGDVTTWSTASNGLPAARTKHAATVWNDRIYVSGGNNTGGTAQNSVYISPQLSGGGNITNTWTTETDTFIAARNGHTMIAYANNLYILGGYDGANYLSDVQFAKMNPVDGTINDWTFTTSLPTPIRQGDGFAANGYMYLVGGRSADGVCSPRTLVAPISANTTIASGNNPTGIGEWYETNKRYSGERYGAAVSYEQGKIYVMGGGCNISSGSSGVLSDDFDPDISGSQWTDTGSTDADDYCDTNSGDALHFEGSNREAETVDVDVTYGGTVSFYLYSGDGGGCNGPEAGEDLVFQYSTNNGGSWTTIATYAADYDPMQQISILVPTPARTNDTRFRWIQNSHSGGTNDVWTIDDLLIEANNAPTFTYTGVNRVVQTALLSQPQVARYSRLIDTDTDVFPNAWLMNGIDNSIGANWQVRYRSMNDTDGIPDDCGSSDMSTWGQETNFGDVTLGQVEPYVPLDGSGNNMNCGRYFYFFISIDASRTFGYPEDVERGPTIADITLYFTSDPSKRLRHGKTFTGGEEQPLDTPCRVSGGGPEHANCPLP